MYFGSLDSKLEPMGRGQNEGSDDSDLEGEDRRRRRQVYPVDHMMIGMYAMLRTHPSQ